MVDPELTDVGELHSLTDWQVSDASDEAELDEFWLTASGGIGDGDFDWKASWDMKPESCEETLDSLIGACWGRLELR